MEFLPLLHFALLERSGGYTHGDRLRLLDLFLFLVKDFLLHGGKIAGDSTEIGTNHLVCDNGINLGGADMFVSEYL